MTKEELKQEAEEKYHNHNITDFQGFYNHHYYYLGYVESAESREKRIAELEKENAEAKEIINAFLDFEASAMERGCYIADDTRKRAEDFIKEIE